MIQFDPNKCVHCWRCIEACNDLVVNEVLYCTSRGVGPGVSYGHAPSLVDSECVGCGECVQLCPTGALTESKSIGKGRHWELERVTTTCPYCGVGCQVEVHVDREQQQYCEGHRSGRSAPERRYALCEREIRL